jgi:hypothetical protein
MGILFDLNVSITNDPCHLSNSMDHPVVYETWLYLSN